MIIALLALALAMIAGGLLSAFLGWDIVLVERGWTMVIAGSVSAASGALLLGLAAVVSKLTRIQAELVRLQDGLDHEEAIAASLPPSVSPAILSSDQSSVSRADVDTSGEEPQAGAPVNDQGQDEGLRETAKWPEASRPTAPILPFRSKPSSEPAPVRAESEPELKVPDFLLSNRHREEEAEARTMEADAALYSSEPAATREEAKAEADVDAEAEQDRVGDLGERAASPEEPEPDAASTGSEAVIEDAAPATIVGTYNSGDNKYVMFSDGSIEAQTPRGVFRFKSLDELKEFIASGGEGNSSTDV